MSVVYIQKTDIGATLTTWIYCAMWQMWAAEQMGINDVYIHWPDGRKPGRCLHPYIDKEKFKEDPNMFNWYFKQPKNSNPIPNSVVTIWTWEDWKDESPIPFMAQPLSVIKSYYQKHLKFSDEVSNRGEAIVNKYNIDFSKTIGVTWRGTDNVTDGRIRMPIEKYFRFIDEILEQHPDYSIMATAEEYGILEPLFDRYPNSFTIDE